MFTAMTVAPRLAAASAVFPSPAATSSTRIPGDTPAVSMSRSEVGPKTADQNV
jgi:hypothetical protein